MEKSVEMLLQKMGEDKAFAERILTQTEKEKVVEIALEAGIELSLKDIDEANEIIAKALAGQTEGELSEEELENVAGGTISVAALTFALTLLLLGSATAGVSALVSVSITVTVGETAKG